jgi:hypothetical protein
VDLLPKDTPAVTRYHPDFTRALPNHCFIYPINPETIGVEIRDPLEITKPCLDYEAQECQLERRIAQRKTI